VPDSALAVGPLRLIRAGRGGVTIIPGKSCQAMTLKSRGDGVIGFIGARSGV